jgi:hypothetical protein
VTFSAPVGQGSKFNPPGVHGNRLYVGTRDGYVIGFGVPEGASVPTDAALPALRPGPAFPNPFGRETTVELTLAKDARVRIDVFDPSGRRLRRLADADFAAGSCCVIWNGLDDMGASAPTGLYLICVDVDRIRHTRRVMLVR